MEEVKKLFPYYHNVVKFFGCEKSIYKTLTPMNHIIDNLFLGDYRAADNLNLLKENKITHIINCAYNLPNKFPNDIAYLNLNLQDIPSQDLTKQVDQGYQFIKSNSTNNILIHCVFGKSRSASVAIYYLMKEQKMDFQTASSFVREKRSIAQVNPGFETQLISLYKNTINI